MREKINFLHSLNDDELINFYPKFLKELKTRGIIRTNNLVAEFAERLVIINYAKKPELPNLTLTKQGTKNHDAVSAEGIRYEIKGTSGGSTSKFESCPVEDDGIKHFDHLVIVIFNKDYELKNIYEFTWDQFLKIRTLKTTEKKWHVALTEEKKKLGIKIV